MWITVIEKMGRMINNKKGFTLIELLVVVAILGILMVVSLANFITSQAKSRDAQRKADLRQISYALEAYLNDHGSYPPATTSPNDGKIKACGCKSASQADPCEWTGVLNRELCDENNTVYMKEVSGDPSGNPNYCYLRSGKSYKLYAKLENNNDQDVFPGGATVICPTDGSSYNFGISSADTKPY